MKRTEAEPQLPNETPEPRADRHARKTASTITDPELDALYDERDTLLRLLAVIRVAGPAA
ncbi:hypothetical protein ACIP5N_33245 [Streptomyces sp. NPDC088768]|uniref:hypothetical protein n=1 Tax=Streptomyces sp. NPDC088768 TaxID=3365894 RepID=UPI00380FA790